MLVIVTDRKKWQNILQDKLPAVADVNVSPFVSRGNSDDRVNIIALKNQVSLAAQTPTMFAFFTNFSSILGTVVLATNILLLQAVGLAAYLIPEVDFRDVN